MYFGKRVLCYKCVFGIKMLLHYFRINLKNVQYKALQILHVQYKLHKSYFKDMLRKFPFHDIILATRGSFVNKRTYTEHAKSSGDCSKHFRGSLQINTRLTFHLQMIDISTNQTSTNKITIAVSDVLTRINKYIMLFKV